MSKKYRQQMLDQVKIQIVSWANANPDWSPESLIHISKMCLKHYGLKNRYLPPDFKKEKEEEAPNADISRVESSDVGSTQS